MVAKIKRFKLKQNSEQLIENKIHRSDASWIKDDATRFVCCPVFIGREEISIYIGFPDDLSKWNDYDYVIVLDEDFCQPYTPFYVKLKDQKWEGFKFLNEFIEKYNEIMSAFDFLEEATDEIDGIVVKEITSYDSNGNPCAWTDLIGGTHDCGVGSDPSGEFCGECSDVSCEGCTILRKEKNI